MVYRIGIPDTRAGPLGDYLNRPADPFNGYEPVTSSFSRNWAQGLLRLGHHLCETGTNPLLPGIGRRTDHFETTARGTLPEHPFRNIRVSCCIPSITGQMDGIISQQDLRSPMVSPVCGAITISVGPVCAADSPARSLIIHFPCLDQSKRMNQPPG